MMFKNYLLIAFRNLVKYKSFSAINILGMGISLASVILISLFVWDELQYDRYHSQGEQVFRLYTVMRSPESGEKYTPMVQPVLADILKSGFPEVLLAARVLGTVTDKQVKVGDQLFNEKRGAFGEGDLFAILDIPVLAGDANDILQKPNTLAIAEGLAEKYFGRESPLGMTVAIDGTDFEITHVFADFPENSHAEFQFLASMSSLSWWEERKQSWAWHQLYTYFRTAEGTDAAGLEERFIAYYQQEGSRLQEPPMSTPFFQNLKDIYLNSSHFDFDHAKTGDKDTIYILSAAALMILLISCFNFINLSTARAVRRMKEVGVRKIIGAQTLQLRTQFLIESCTFAVTGVIIALLLAWIAMPHISTLSDKELPDGLSFGFLVGALLFGLLLGLLSGAYPAFLLSSFKPAAVFAGAKQARGGHAHFRYGLVVFQFVLSFSLMIGAWIVIEQNQLLNNKDLGFNEDNLMVVYGIGVEASRIEAIKNEVSRFTMFGLATWGYGLPGDLFATDRVEHVATGEKLSTKLFMIDFDYIRTMGMEIVAGRDFSKSFGTDETSAFLINETAAVNFGMGSPGEAIGQELKWDRWDGNGSKTGKIIGVVRDFHTGSLKEKISPVVMQVQPGIFYTLTARLSPENLEEQVAAIEGIFREQVPDRLFSYAFLDQKFKVLNAGEQRLSRLLTLFAGLNIFVACLGLYGLVEYHVHHRAKEISIRKVFGAGIASLLLALTRQYFVLVFLAFVLSAPLIWYAAQLWLADFAYPVAVTPLVYLKSALLITLITALTVSFHSIKTAYTNPSTVLKEN